MNFNFAHYFVLDVESIGLHGEGYAAAYAVFDLQGRELEAHTFACDPSNAVGDASDRAWVKKRSSNSYQLQQPQRGSTVSKRDFGA
jgi:hypothetical protein